MEQLAAVLSLVLPPHDDYSDRDTHYDLVREGHMTNNPCRRNIHIAWSHRFAVSSLFPLFLFTLIFNSIRCFTSGLFKVPAVFCQVVSFVPSLCTFSFCVIFAFLLTSLHLFLRFICTLLLACFSLQSSLPFAFSPYLFHKLLFIITCTSS